MNRAKRTEMMREDIQKFRNVFLDIGGYFYKRKSSYFHKNDKVKSAGSKMSGFLSKLGASSAKYDKRYFYLDTMAATFSYGKDENSALNNPSYKVQLRDIESVTKSIVSMPVKDNNGEITSFTQMSIYDTNPNIDRGPEFLEIWNVFEVKLGDRMLTLYSNDNIMYEKFVLCLSKILELKNQILDHQKREDE